MKNNNNKRFLIPMSLVLTLGLYACNQEDINSNTEKSNTEILNQTGSINKDQLELPSREAFYEKVAKINSEAKSQESSNSTDNEFEKKPKIDKKDKSGKYNKKFDSTFSLMNEINALNKNINSVTINLNYYTEGEFEAPLEAKGLVTLKNGEADKYYFQNTVKEKINGLKSNYQSYKLDNLIFVSNENQNFEVFSLKSTDVLLKDPFSISLANIYYDGIKIMSDTLESDSYEKYEFDEKLDLHKIEITQGNYTYKASFDFNLNMTSLTIQSLNKETNEPQTYKYTFKYHNDTNVTVPEQIKKAHNSNQKFIETRPVNSLADTSNELINGINSLKISDELNFDIYYKEEIIPIEYNLLSSYFMYDKDTYVYVKDESISYIMYKDEKYTAVEFNNKYPETLEKITSILNITNDLFSNLEQLIQINNTFISFDEFLEYNTAEKNDYLVFNFSNQTEQENLTLSKNNEYKFIDITVNKTNGLVKSYANNTYSIEFK